MSIRQIDADALPGGSFQTRKKGVNTLSKMLNAARVRTEYLGLVPYQEALSYQERLREGLWEDFKNQRSITHHLLGLEHPSVITLGKRANQDLEVLQAGATEVLRTGRGGLATLHAPGQLVIYPVFHLKNLNLGVRGWVECLLNTTAKTLRDFQVEATATYDPAGVYTSHGKIAFVGVQIRQGISTHGLSINISNNLSEFQKIQSCGMSHAALDSVEKQWPSLQVNLKNFFEKWSVVFFENLRKIKAPLDAGLMG